MTSKPAGNTPDQGADRSADRKPREVRSGQRFRKKPIVVEAWHFDGSWESAKPIVAQAKNIRWGSLKVDGVIYIETLEGTMEASPGDWIIKGTRGEFYPCKPDVFADVYEPEAATALATQDARIKELEAALEPFQSGEWGAVKAWIVNGAPSRDQGIAAARLLTKHQYRVDEVLAALKTEAR